MKTMTMILMLMVAGPAMADPKPQVKLSRSGICHGVDSPWFARVSNFKAFKTMADCLATGAREPKRKKKKAKGGTQ